MGSARATGPTDPNATGGQATTGASVLRGGAWLAVSQNLPQLYTLALSVIAARFLGPDQMGRQSFIAFAALAVTLVLTSSLFVALMRYVGETVGRGRPEAARGLLLWAWKIEGALAVVAAAVFLAIALAGATPQGAWALAGAVCALGVMHTVPTAVLVGLQRFREASIAGLVTGALGIGATAAVLAAGGGITGMFAVEAVAGAANLVWTGLLARRRIELVAPHAQSSPMLQRLVARYALISGIGVLLELVVTRRSEVFFLNRSSTDSEIAFYSIAFAAVTAFVQIPRSFASAVSPAFATLHGAGAPDRMRDGFWRGLRLLTLFTMPALALSLVLGPRLIELVYGSDFSGAGTPLLIMLAAFPVIPAVSLCNALLAGLARVRVPLMANAFAAAVDVGLAALLVPRLDAVGAAIANTSGALVYGGIVGVNAGRLVVPVDLDLRSLFVGVVATAVAAAAGWAVVAQVDGFAGLCAAFVVVVVLYLAGARALRIIPHRDEQWLEGALGRRFGPVAGRACRPFTASAHDA
jgi:O-antigen/teichoic acid export membrane protein